MFCLAFRFRFVFQSAVVPRRFFSSSFCLNLSISRCGVKVIRWHFDPGYIEQWANAADGWSAAGVDNGRVSRDLSIPPSVDKVDEPCRCRRPAESLWSATFPPRTKTSNIKTALRTNCACIFFSAAQSKHRRLAKKHLIISTTSQWFLSWARLEGRIIKSEVAALVTTDLESWLARKVTQRGQKKTQWRYTSGLVSTTYNQLVSAIRNLVIKLEVWKEDLQIKVCRSGRSLGVCREAQPPTVNAQLK